MKTLTKSPDQTEATLSLYDADQMISFSGHLQQFFAENNLVCDVQGKTHVKVPGWQYAGTKLGIIPMVEEVLDLSTDKEIRYQTRVALLNIKTNQYVGCGIAICSNSETGKRNKPAYAIQSQSQTRAIGKAFRNLLGWVVELAGYESDPAEEQEAPAINEEEAQKLLQQTVVGLKAKKVLTEKRRELLLALNHECIDRAERDKMFMCIDKLTMDRCEQALAKVSQKIKEYNLDNH